MSATAILPPRRERNGRRQRPKRMTVEQIAAAEREQRLRETELVRSQPHRRVLPDPASDKAHSHLGRFCEFFSLPIELYWAGERYREAVNCWRAINRLRHHKTGNGDGIDLSEAETAAAADRARAYMLACDRAIYEAGAKAYLATRSLCIDDHPVTPEMTPRVQDGLHALERHFDRVTRQRVTVARLMR